MAGLEFRFLGDFAVLRDGRELPLPPSRKTRALLAYLALQPRRFRREQLSELLWDVPDDPLGSLRWSLSKLRRLVDGPDRERLVADRNSVAFEPADVAIDVRELRELVLDPARAATPALEQAAARHRGSFLEGLEFSSFHAFHAWCMAEREQALRDRAVLLGELVARLGDTPERALAHARALVGLFPYEEAHRAALIKLLNAVHQVAEAEEQYQLGLRMLKEAGVNSTGALLDARRKPRIDAPPLRTPQRVSDEHAHAPQADGRLVGRDAEIARIAATLHDVARTPRAAVLLLVGAPGIGKSRVLEATLALARQQDAFVLQAAGFESDTIRPFSVWTDALRLQPGAAHDAVFQGAEASDRDGLFARLSDLVARESATRPVVLLVDDAQWCDESSAAALLYVARMNKVRSVLAVLAVREAELRDNVPLQQVRRGLLRDGLLVEIELGPLPAPDLAQLIELQVPGADAARLGADCSGNPLLALELARAERAGDAAGTLDELVRERLTHFGATGADALRWAAVLSPRIQMDTLAKVSGIDPGAIATALDAAERHAMLRSGEHGLRFVHDLIARAIYTDISPLRRQVMHRRIAELLERDMALDLARAAELAHHATQSADAALAARALVAAGRLCLRFFANDDAAALARRGLQLAVGLRDAERVCVEIDLHDILLAARPLDPAAAQQYTTLAERALDHGALAHARLGYHMAATVRWAAGHWGAAREQTLQAMRAVRGGRDEAQIVGMAETAKCLAMIERDIPQADAMLMEASVLARRSGFSHHAIAAGLGMLRFHENRLDEAAELFDEARTMCKSAGDRFAEYQANEYLVMIHLQRGRLADARERSRELLALGDKLRQGSEEPFARAMAGLCDYAIDDEAGRLDAALADLRVADAKHRLAYVLTRAALLDCERGRAASAKRRAAEALDHATALERPTEMLLANAVLSRDCATRGDRPGAEGHALEARRLAGRGAALWTGQILAALETS